MRHATEDGAWDLTPVIDLIYSLSLGRKETTINNVPERQDRELPTTPADPPESDFQCQLGNFDKIWTYLGQPLDVPPPLVVPLLETDATIIPGEDSNVESTAGKGVRWRDEVEGAGLEDNDAIGDAYRNAKRNKSQRKKERKKASLERRDQTRDRPETDDNGSESDTQTSRQPPDRRAVIQQILYGKSDITCDRTLTDSQPIATASPESLRTATGQADLAAPKLHSKLSVRSAQFVPSWEQQALQIAAIKKAQLVAILHARFVDERQYMSNVSVVHHVMTTDKCNMNGIHVFVDASNIMIGFHDALKLARGLPIFTRIGRQPLSFHNLSLILERGRPAAKRVLVGSDNFPAIQEAKVIGYETNILDRVHKAKELTPRQKKYRIGNGNATSGQSSGSETPNATTHAPEKWVEQAVDEILHLKILESVVDAKQPSTIVLATGDAAEAEYSEGFLKMVERALDKGWKVELVSFRHNTSGAYKRKHFRTKWSAQFKILELDDYVELLLGI